MRQCARGCSAGVVGTLMMLATAGCTENENSLFIKGVISREPGDCGEVSPDPGSTLLANGVLDLALTDRYVAALLVGNQMVQKGDPGQNRVETMRTAIRGAEVHVVNERDRELDAYTTDATGFVDPSSGDASYGVVFATLVPDVASLNYGGRGSGQITIRVRVFGETTGGKEVESSELYFPMQLCTCCLIDYVPNEESTSGPYTCPAARTEEDERPCSPGQDWPLSCTFCSGVNDYCDTPLNCSEG